MEKGKLKVPEVTLPLWKQYYIKNIEKIKKYQSDWYLKNKAHVDKMNREWYYKNKEKRTIKIKEWQKLSGGRHKFLVKRWSEENKEKHTKMKSDWKKRNKRRVVGYTQKRKGLMLGAGGLTYQTIQLVYEDNIKRFGTLTCYLCLKPIEFGQDSIEHLTPLCRGGNNDYINLGVAHKKCNCHKGKRTLEEWKRVS